jgi:hypothetical protein
MPDDGLRKGRNMFHAYKSQVKVTYVVFDGVIVVYSAHSFTYTTHKFHIYYYYYY